MENKKRKISEKLIILICLISILLVAAVVVGIILITNSVHNKNILSKVDNAKTALGAECYNNIEDDTYFCVKDGDNEVWFKYVNGEVIKTEKQDSFDTYYIKLNNSDVSIDENITIYTPIVKAVERKINSYLTETMATTYKDIADACNNLSNLFIKVLNNPNGYKFAYSIENNAVLLVNSDMTEIVYSSTNIEEIPEDVKLIVGANINNANDLIAFSNISNLYNSETKAATEENIYVYNKPIVVLNINNNIDIATSNDAFKPIANWDSLWSSNWQEILILINGNNKTISNINDALVGNISAGSMIRDINLKYKIGSEEEPMTNSATPNNAPKQIFHFGLIAKTLTKNGEIKTQDNILVTNIKVGGKVYLKDLSGSPSINDVGALFGMVANGSATGDNKLFTFNNCSLFMDEGDYIGFEGDNPEIFALLIGNPEKNQFEWTDITYSEENIHNIFNSLANKYPHVMPYIGVIA
ncbi:MAG: hypothetical protein IJT25_00050 [Clostridia bacterium]|nr:hypothetical protein [Clostridia bacterium]